MTVCTGCGRTFILEKYERCERMLWFRIPEKIYFKKGCMELALDELKTVYNKKRAFIVTEPELYKNGYINALEKKLKSIGIQYTVFTDIRSKVTFNSVEEGVKAMRLSEPDTVIALGTDKAVNSAKLMRVLYEKPDTDLKILTTHYNSIRNTEEIFSRNNKKTLLVVIPVLYGNGSEVMPYAEAVNEENNESYLVANYSLMPDMSIIDSDYYRDLPETFGYAPGFNQLALALFAYKSPYSSEYTDGFAIQAVKNIFEYLPLIYQDDERNITAEEKISEASVMAGIASANTDMSICSVMSGALSDLYNIDSNVACAIILSRLVNFYATKSERICKKLSVLAKLIGMNDVDGLISGIEKLKNKCGFQQRISKLRAENEGSFIFTEEYDFEKYIICTE